MSRIFRPNEPDDEIALAPDEASGGGGYGGYMPGFPKGYRFICPRPKCKRWTRRQNLSAKIYCPKHKRTLMIRKDESGKI